MCVHISGEDMFVMYYMQYCMSVSATATAHLIHALNSIRIDYCNSVLYNLPKSIILRLLERFVVIISQKFLLISIGYK